MTLERSTPIKTNSLTAALSILVSMLICTLSISPVYADETSLNVAIDAYLVGFRACNEANNLRSSDLAQAKANFNYYTQQLNKAIAIDETILITSSREMETNIKYCKRVESNIQRAEATPILEQGIDFCKLSKAALTDSNLTLAASEIGQYQELKEQALIIAPDLMEVFVLASKIRTCTRVEEKLQKAVNAATLAEEEMKKAIIAYQDFKAQCETARQFTSKPNFGIYQLLKANKLLTQAHKRKKSARQNAKAFELAEKNPSSENAIALVSLIKESQQCESDVSSAIRRVTKAKRSNQKQLSNASKSLASALKECKSAQKEFKSPLTAAEINTLKGLYNATSDVKESITSNKLIMDLSQQHKTWPQSKSLKQNLKSTTSCLSIFDATLKAIKPIPNTPVIIDSNATPDPDPDTDTDTDTDTLTKAENLDNTTTNPAQTNTSLKTPPTPTEEISEKLTEAEVTNNTEDSDDEFDEFDTNDPSQKHKSWLDVIN
ncbi:hypothetical protein A9Q81_25705 [Gammaproteobacteria bacterium 42_54_T18]|nr:hypothetical protein A9Q81_25705 [Gammaproteobacteria bacterium 42_54_T18]